MCQCECKNLTQKIASNEKYVWNPTICDYEIVDYLKYYSYMKSVILEYVSIKVTQNKNGL